MPSLEQAAGAWHSKPLAAPSRVTKRCRVDSPGVVIEVPAIVREAAERGPLVSACTSVVSEGGCTLSPGARETIAVLSFPDDAGLVVRIEVRTRNRDGHTASTETLAQFSAGDPESERWQSLGLLIGAAANQLRARDTASKTRLEVVTAADAPRGTVRIAASSAHASEPEKQFRVRFGPGVGVDFGDGTVELGGAFDAGFRVHELVELRAAVTYAHSTRAARVTIDQLSFFGGIGLPLFRSDEGFHGSMFLEAGPELVRASIAPTAGERVVGVTRVGLDLGHDFDWFTVGLTTSLEREWSKTNVRVDGARVGEAGVYSAQWTALLGAAF